MSDFQKMINGLQNLNRLPSSSLDFAVPKMTMPKIKSDAEWTYERLGKYIQTFEKGLDEEHEIGARLVSFGNEMVFHIEKVGYWGPNIITFHGLNNKGEKVQLVQNTSQLSVLLVAMKKLGDKPKRIGFMFDKTEEE